MRRRRRRAVGRIGGEDENALGGDAVGDESREAARQRLGLARPRRAEQQQGPLAVLDGALLCFGEGEHVPTLASARRP